MATRYDQLNPIIEEINPSTIVEIGTWNGERALQMCAVCPSAKYYGYDLFEEASEETDMREFNVKSHHFLAEVQRKLAILPNEIQLVKGDTRETLEGINYKIDFAFIDGGHSEETIRSDWEMLKPHLNPGAVVVFDDFYSPEKPGFGCNQVVAGLDYEFLPEAGRAAGGLIVKMVKVTYAPDV